MITAVNLTKSFGTQVLFKDLSFTVGKGEKIGLVGRNGHGKTTLLQMITGKIQPDSGKILFPNNYRIGYMEQHINFSKETVLDEACAGLGENEKDETWKVRKILMGLGFREDDLMKNPSEFSGGYQIRLNLAKVLVSKPDLLLLDEPNNYLDIVAIRWLEDFLKAWKNEIMLITHDRMFMDSIITHTVLIHRQKARKIEGKTGKMYSQVAQDEEVYENTRVNEEKKTKQVELFITRFRAKARLAGLTQSRIKTLEKKEKLERLEKIEELDFSFNYSDFPASHMMKINNIVFSYDGRPPFLINKLSLNIGRKDRICVIGKNGKGKSTLLRLLAGELEPVDGNIKKHNELKAGYFWQTNIKRLLGGMTVYEEIMSADPKCTPQKARNISGALMFSEDNALKKISVLSGGEKSRVLLGKILAAPCSLLLLDEPTNHLDMESSEALLAAIEEFEGSVVIVTHNEMYLHRLAKRLVVFDRDKVSLFEGPYKDFLDKVGWEEGPADSEISKRTERPGPGGGNFPKDKKALKRAKAEFIEKRYRTLDPLKKEIEKLEQAINEQEKEENNLNTELVGASQNGNVGLIRELPKKIAALKKSIEGMYERLFDITNKYESEQKKFDEEYEKVFK